MKRIKLILVLMIMGLYAVSLHSQTHGDPSRYMEFLKFKVIDEEKAEAALYGYISHFEDEGGWGPGFPVMSTITIPEKVTIGKKEYTVVEISDNALKNLGYIDGDNSRYEDFSPSRIVLPATIRRLGKYALNVSSLTGNTSIVSVDLPDALEQIGDYCFNYNQSGSLKFPKNLKSLGIGNICGIWMDNVTFLNSGMTITKEMVYDKANGSGYLETIGTLTITGTDMTVGEDAFAGVKIKNLELGESPVALKKGAFWHICDYTSNYNDFGAAGTVTVRCLEPYAISSSAFSEETFAKATLYVPESAFEAYKTTQGWSKFANIKALPNTEGMLNETTIWNYYAKTDEQDLRIGQYKLRFSGKVTIDGKQYYRCYRYTGDTFNANALTPCAFARQDGNRVYVRPNPAYNLANDPSGLAVGGNLSTDESGEILLYDFSSTDAMKAIYGNEVEKTDNVTYNDAECFAYQLGESRFVMGVGLDSPEDGDLLSPMIRSGELGSAGLMTITDLNGDVLYDGTGTGAYKTKHELLDLTALDYLQWTYWVTDVSEAATRNYYYNMRVVREGDNLAKVYRFQGEFNPEQLTPCAYIALRANGNIVVAANPDYPKRDFDIIPIEGDYSKQQFSALYAYSVYKDYDYNISTEKIAGAYRRVYNRKLYNLNNTPIELQPYEKVVEGLGYDIRSGIGIDQYSGLVTQYKYATDLVGWYYRQYNVFSDKIYPYTQGGLCLVTNNDGEVVYEGVYADLYRNDLNKDCLVDVADINFVIGACVNPTALPAGINADVNRDGIVDVADINQLINTMLGK